MFTLQINKSEIAAGGLINRVRQEVTIHSKLNHPAILKLYAFFEDQSFVYLVLELCSRGELQKHIKSLRRVLNEDEGNDESMFPILVIIIVVIFAINFLFILLRMCCSNNLYSLSRNRITLDSVLLVSYLFICQYVNITGCHKFTSTCFSCTLQNSLIIFVPNSS